MSSTATVSTPAATTTLACRPAASRPDRASPLGWAVTLFSSLRIVAYLPTAWEFTQLLAAAGFAAPCCTGTGLGFTVLESAPA